MCIIFLLKEEKLRNSGDPKFLHLKDDLHVEITAFAPPAEAHARIAYALTEVRRFLVPVSVLYNMFYMYFQLNLNNVGMYIIVIIVIFKRSNSLIHSLYIIIFDVSHFYYQ